MSKIGCQSQSGVIQDFTKVLDKHPIAWKLLGQAVNLGLAQTIRAHSPQTLIILRAADDNWSLDAGVEDYASRAMRTAEPFLLAGCCDLLESPNEPVVGNSTDAKRLNDQMVQLATIYKSNGFRPLAYNFSVGNPEYALWPYLNDGILFSDGWLGLHQYGAPSLQSNAPDFSLRHRKVYPLLSPQARSNLKIVVSEAGIDLGILGQSGGYRALPKQGDSEDYWIQNYTSELSWWDSQLAQDPYVIASTLFGYSMVVPWVGMGFDVADVDSDRSYFINWLQGGVTPPDGGGMSTPQERINAAWGGTGVSFNPDAAFFKFAQANKLGYPVTNEYRYTDAAGGKRAGQGFSVAFVECADGDWANIKPYDWLTGELYVAPVNPPNGGIPPFSIPPALTQFGASAVEGTVVSGQAFYRLTGATVRSGVSAFCKITIVGKNGAPLIGVYVINLRPDGNKEIQVTDGSGVVQFFYGAGSAFSVPGSGPFTNGVVDSAGNFLQGDKAISLGDYQGTHTEWYLQFTRVQ